MVWCITAIYKLISLPEGSIPGEHSTMSGALFVVKKIVSAVLNRRLMSFSQGVACLCFVIFISSSVGILYAQTEEFEPDSAAAADLWRINDSTKLYVGASFYYMDPNDSIVVWCDTSDSDLIGKKFEEGKKQLDIKENFYKGEEIFEEKAIPLLQDLLKDDATFNIVGPESVQASIKAGIITKGHCSKVNGIPFALILI